MASILKHKALSNIKKGNTSAYYSYVEEKNGTNPVLQQLEKELFDYMGFVRKKQESLLKPGEHAPCKVSDALFDIWNKFEPRITKRHFYQKLMQIGEFLVQNKEYSAAAWQCYDRYLNQFIKDINFSMIKNVQDLKEKFFPESESNEENNDMTFRALMGHCICLYHFTLQTDPKLQNVNSIQQLCEVLRIIRLIMQFQLEVEEYCWLVYNGTIYMYTICRYMMQYGLGKQVLEYLIWSCLCMETSIPLLGIKYLTWRATLYVATCQCYYDCKYSEDGEAFARRALSKINELHELELASVNGPKGAEAPQFRDATIKIGTMLFKRIVFESRRKAKNVLRPKTRMAYKDLPTLIWPRTQTEKLLADMFDCASSRFLAIEEALSDSNRRIAMPQPAAGEYDVEMLDVVLELFYAAEYIANGGGGKKSVTFDKLSEFKAVVSTNKTLIEMAIENEDTVPIRNLLRIIQLAFSYENWDMYRRLSNKILAFFQTSSEIASKFNTEIQILNLLQTIDKYLLHLRRLKMMKNEAIKASLQQSRQSPTRSKRPESELNSKDEKNSQKGGGGDSDTIAGGSDEENPAELVAKSGKSKKSTVKSKSRGMLSEIAEDADLAEDAEADTASLRSSLDSTREEDLLANIANKLMQVISLNIKSEKLDLDIMNDTTLLLWKKCKEMFQKHQTGAHDNYRWVTKFENLPRWLYILNAVHESMCYFNISSIDPAVFAHCTLRLGLIYESLANVGSRKSASNLHVEDDRITTVRILDLKSAGDVLESFSEKLMTNDVRGNLVKAKKILKKSLKSLASARASISKSDKSCLCNKNYDEGENEENDGCNSLEQLKALKENIFQYKKNQQGDSIWNMIGDLHIELIFLYNKISVRLLEYGDATSSALDINTNFEKNFEQLLKECKKNKITQSLLYLAKSLYLNTSPSLMSKYASQQKELIEKAYKCLLKAQDEDKRLFYKHVKVDATVPTRSKVPLPPVVYLTTHNKIVLAPCVFQPTDDTAVSWYRVFASQVIGPNSKARISDYSFPGSGDQIPSNSSDQVVIQGLTADENYIFAVAAYDQNGKLIGDSIGESTDPILASSTLSILMNWAYLCQVSYQTENYSISKVAFDVLWQYFIFKPIEKPKETVILHNEIDYQVTFHQLNYNVVRKTSPILLRKFLECLFISVDIEVKESKIYPDMIFDGKIPYPKQIERLRECEKMTVAIDLAGWLNDSQIILQAVVQCYGLVAPLIYYYIPYEPIIKILTHCLLVMEELPTSLFQRKPKPIFESLQHMNACTTYYLTEILKKMNKKTLANVFNLMGRKLLSIEENPNLAAADDENEFFSPNVNEPKPKSSGNTIMAQAQNLQKKKDKTSKNQQQQLVDEKPVAKNDEWKALELYLARSSKPAAIYSILNGNEDTTFIYAFITQSPTKYAYKELIKFRRRTSYMELFNYFLHKAMLEELNTDIREWCQDTQEWLVRRNVAILGNRSVVTKKPGVIAVGGNQVSISNEFADDADKKTLKASTSTLNFTSFKKRKIKKYKLLIPLDLDGSEKTKMEDKQKAAIDKIYDLFPDMHEQWIRKKRLRRLLQEESAFKAQYYNTWGLTEFSILMNRIQHTNPQNELVLFTRIYSNDYVEPQHFLFDTNNCLLLSEENRYNKELFKLDDDKAELLPVPPNRPKPQAAPAAAAAGGKAGAKAPSKARTVTKTPSKASKTHGKSSMNQREKIYDIKDTAELLADAFNGLDVPEETDEAKSTTTAAFKDAKRGSQPGGQSVSRITNFTNLSTVQVSALTFREIVDSLKKIIFRFNQAIVVAHRYKEWTLLQNSCKNLWNCLNSLLVWLPAMSADNVDIKLNDIWTISGSCLFTAADCLLDMIFCTVPIERSNSRDFLRRLNKWFDSLNVGKGGSGLKHDIPLDDASSIDLRFIKKLIFRAVQCLFVNKKWEKVASIIFKFNALTSFSFAEQLSPVLIYSQHQLRKQLILKAGSDGDRKNPTHERELLKQPHFERLKAELGRQAKAEDLLFIQFKIQIDPASVKPLNLGVKIDPRVHDIYDGGDRARQLISVPLDIDQTKQSLKEALEDTLYTSRALIHARRLFSIYLLSKSKQAEFFGIKQHHSDLTASAAMKKSYAAGEQKRGPGGGRVEFDNENLERLRQQPKYAIESSPNPAELLTKTFENVEDICVMNANIDLKIVIESYKKCISLLTGQKERDLAVQAMHELGNIYYSRNDLKNAYYWWNESLDLLTSVKDCLIKWRNEFLNKEKSSVDYIGLLEKYGIWGCFTGGLLASKFAQYLLPNDLEMRTEACLLSAAFYKSIYQASVPHSKYDVDYTKEDSETVNTEFLLPGLNLNNDLYRFDIRNLIQSMNYICLELNDAKYSLTIMPVLNLYEYFARNMTRDINHTITARLFKIEALININKYTEAITLLQRIHRGERLPHAVDEKFKPHIQSTVHKFLYVNWNPSKPIYDVNNLKCLETILSMKLPFNALKFYGPHIICRFYMVQCKLFVQIASHLTCMPNMKDFNSSELFEFQNSFKSQKERIGTSRFTPGQAAQPLQSQKKHNANDNPDTIKVFSKCKNLTLEFIKGCLLGTAKVLLSKCTRLFSEDFPHSERYCVSPYWQREFKYEVNMQLASIADQCQVDYMALQYVIDAMNELAVPKQQENGEDFGDTSLESFKYSSLSTFMAPKGVSLDSKQSKHIKKGMFEVFDLMSKSHLNSRLWMNARKTFAKYMLNQLSDLGKAKGVDPNIIRDFADLKYYCDKGFEEATLFQDCESKAHFEFMIAVLDLTQTNDLHGCLNKLQSSLSNLRQCAQLSLEGEKLYIKVKLLQIDISYSLNLMDMNERNDLTASENPISDVVGELGLLQDYIFEKLKYYDNEAIEMFTNRSLFYLDFISGDIKNLSNTFLSYLLHVKLRLGSCLVIRATNLTPVDADSLKSWQDALKMFYYCLQLNKVITERSVGIEIEAKYKYARCLRELFIRKQCHVREVVDTYLEVINLSYYSTHDLTLIKNCYLELAMTFTHLFNPSVSTGTPALFTQTPDTRSRKTAATAKAIEGALICFTFAIQVSQSIREKMLLPGHSSLKQMESVQTKDSPIFIANDLLAYYVLAERKRVYKDKIEEEVLTLAPEFEPKMPVPTYDDKFAKLCIESDKSITWTHLLNYHTKMQRISSMKNLNQLSSGQNRFKYSEFYTLSFTPVFNNYNQVAARLYKLNSYLSSNLPIYNSECVAVFPLVDALRVCSRKAYSSSIYLSKEKDIKALLETVKSYDGNKGTVEVFEKPVLLENEGENTSYQEVEQRSQQVQNNSQSSDDQNASNSQNTTFQVITKSTNWSYLEQWPSNYDYSVTDVNPNKHIMDILQVLDYLVTINWYKDLNLKDPKYGHVLTAVLSVKDASGLNNHQIRIKFLSAEKVYDVHHKLATLAAIADTALETDDNKNVDMKNEFINSLKACLREIAEIFNKNLEETSDMFSFFELKASNVIDLERMFNPMFGGKSNNETLKTFLFNFFTN